MAPRVGTRSDRAGAAVAARRRVGAGAGGPSHRRRLPDARRRFGRERTSGVLEEVASRLSFIHEYLTTAATRPRFEAFVADAAAAAVRRARLLPAPRPRPTTAARCAPSSSPRSARSRAIPTSIAQARSARRPRARRRRRARPDAGEARSSRPRRARRRGAVRRAVRRRRRARRRPGRALPLSVRARRASAIRRSIDRGLQLALSPQLRSQDTASYLARFLANPDARERAPGRSQANTGRRSSRRSRSSAATRTLIASMASFCDARPRDDITAFFAEHKLPAAARTLDQTIERINNCIDLREKQTPARWRRGCDHR